MSEFIISFSFDYDFSQSQNISYSIKLSNLDDLLESLLEQGILCPGIDNDLARYDINDFALYMGSELEELCFTVQSISNGKESFPIPDQKRMNSAETLIELSEMYDAYNEYGDKFTTIYDLCNNCEQAVAILEELK